MKLVLSRKGFDASAGGAPSPILAGGRMISLPIPDRASPVRYRDIHAGEHPLGELVVRQTRGRVRAADRAHLDPDLVRAARPRPPGWRPVFGQAGAAQTVLARAGVGPGDLFLFFGWFRDEARRDAHVIFGWLQVARVLDLARTPLPAWAAEHPHAFGVRPGNTLYVATRALSIAPRLPGAGVFTHHAEARVLTAPGASRSRWRLPAWFHPGPGRPPLGYHADPRRWRRAGPHVLLDSAKRGQELVLDTAAYPEALPWLAALFTSPPAPPRTR